VLLAEKGGSIAADHLEMAVGMIVFEDGTAWDKGQMLRRDPDNPERWIPITDVNSK
jgi:hypothetical protein